MDWTDISLAGQVTGCFECVTDILFFPNMRGNYGLAEEFLASLEGPYPMELVN